MQKSELFEIAENIQTFLKLELELDVAAFVFFFIMTLIQSVNSNLGFVFVFFLHHLILLVTGIVGYLMFQIICLIDLIFI